MSSKTPNTAHEINSYYWLNQVKKEYYKWAIRYALTYCSFPAYVVLHAPIWSTNICNGEGNKVQAAIRSKKASHDLV